MLKISLYYSSYSSSFSWFVSKLISKTITTLALERGFLDGMSWSCLHKRFADLNRVICYFLYICMSSNSNQYCVLLMWSHMTFYFIGLKSVLLKEHVLQMRVLTKELLQLCSGYLWILSQQLSSSGYVLFIYLPARMWEMNFWPFVTDWFHLCGFALKD